LIDILRNSREMAAERFRDAGKIRVVAEQNFLSNREVQLRRRATGAMHNSQRVERLAAHVFGPQEMIAPWLQAKVDRGL
jgi:hypothetical protein